MVANTYTETIKLTREVPAVLDAVPVVLEGGVVAMVSGSAYFSYCGLCQRCRQVEVV